MVLLIKIVLSAAVVWAWVLWIESGIKGPHPAYMRVGADINAIFSALECKRFSAGHPSPADAALDKQICSNDPWGNPYHHERVEDPATKEWEFRVYSTGQDGRSASGGNDPDDINSWDDHHQKFYHRADKLDRVRGNLIATIVFGLPVFLVLHGLHLGARAVWLRMRVPPGL